MSENRFLKHSGVEHPIICGAMYPCSNPELVAAAAEAGGLGVIQPLSLSFVHNKNFREGLKQIRSLTEKPLGLNIIVEKSSKLYERRAQEWCDIAIEEGIRFFVTALGNPAWVIRKVKQVGGYVYHDVTEKKFALKVIDKGVDGLICVNMRAGGHAGYRSNLELFSEMKDFGLPLICAGGIGGRQGYQKAMAIGYEGIQMGTRFIATKECTAHEDYKNAIVSANEDQIVLTERVTGVPLAVIRTPLVERVGTKVGTLARLLMKGRKTKHWVRLYYSLSSVFSLKRSNFRSAAEGASTKDYWQAGKSVSEIDSIKSVSDVISDMVRD